MLNYLDVASKKIEDLSKLVFLSEKNESLKRLIISLIIDGNDKEKIQSKISIDYEQLIQEIKENSSIHIIARAKNQDAILELMSEIIIELRDLNSLKRIESLEKDLINNLDENSYSELVKLKSQLNRE